MAVLGSFTVVGSFTTVGSKSVGSKCVSEALSDGDSVILLARKSLAWYFFVRVLERLLFLVAMILRSI